MSSEQIGAKSLKKDQTAAVSRRDFLKLASASGVASATSGFAFASGAAVSKSDDGTPEQIHITWGNDPATEVAISWSSPGTAPGTLLGILLTLLKTRFGPLNVTPAPGMASVSLITKLAVRMEKPPIHSVTITPWVPTKPQLETMSCSKRLFSKKKGEDRL